MMPSIGLVVLVVSAILTDGWDLDRPTEGTAGAVTTWVSGEASALDAACECGLSGGCAPNTCPQDSQGGLGPWVGPLYR
jgi:hypothetical protein